MTRQFFVVFTSSTAKFRRAAVGMEIPMGIPMGMGMGMGTVMNPHGSVGILWGFLNGCEIKRKRVKYAIVSYVIVDV